MNTSLQQMEAEGGRASSRSGPVTRQQRSIGLTLVVVAVSAELYVESKFDNLVRGIGENTERLAVVGNEVKALRRDISQLDNNASPSTSGIWPPVYAEGWRKSQSGGNLNLLDRVPRIQPLR